MNHFLLFAGGIVLGVLLSLSFLSHIRTSPSSQKELAILERYSNTTESEAFTQLPQRYNSTKISNSNETLNQNRKVIRWSPGKSGTFDKLKNTADLAQAEIFGSSSTSFSQDVPNNVELNAMERYKLRKQQKAALQMKRKTAKALKDDFINEVNILNQTVDNSLSIMMPSNRWNSNITKVVYHSQALQDYSNFIPYIPTFEDAIAKNLHPAPDMSLQRAAYEKDNLKLHLCNEKFEAYSASYLTTKQHMLSVASEKFNLTWVNCEMASFIHMSSSNKFYHSPHHEGVIMQSLDVLDFSVIHLSAYERSSHKHRDALWKNKKDMIREWHDISPVIHAGKMLAALNDPKQQLPENDPARRTIHYLSEARRTVVVMPFLGGSNGAGHSKLANRYQYLRTCFWSLYEFFPNIVAGVSTQEDVDWGLKESGLPFFEIILISIPKGAGLPVGLTQQTKLRLQDGRWGDMDYVFFTESDQILISRELPLMYAHLKKYPGHMLLPHRLMPYSYRAITEVHQRSAAVALATTQPDLNLWMNQSCCMPRQNCNERKSWVSVKDESVGVINYYGLYVPLGNINFLDEKYRACKLMNYVGEKAYCP